MLICAIHVAMFISDGSFCGCRTESTWKSRPGWREAHTESHSEDHRGFYLKSSTASDCGCSESQGDILTLAETLALGAG